MRRFAPLGALVALAFAGCFSPSYDDTACSAAGECPDGYVCAPATNRCVASAAIDAPVADADTTGADARTDATPAADARVDAVPVECTDNGDCANPPDNCLLPGTCNLVSSTCTFPAVDCSSMDDACNAGVCDPSDGSCVKQPTNGGNQCMPDTVTGCDSCSGFAGECGEDGTQTCTCTSYACNAGTCEPTATSCQQDCQRITENLACGAGTALSACGSCNYSGTCDEDAERTCTCTDYTCTGGSCTPGTPYSCQDNCSRSTTGNTCGAGLGEVVTDPGCNYTSLCDESATNAKTCRDNTCVNETCTPGATYDCSEPCSRTTDGNTCDFRQGSCPPGSFREYCCTNGSCTDPCGFCEQ